MYQQGLLQSNQSQRSNGARRYGTNREESKPTCYSLKCECEKSKNHESDNESNSDSNRSVYVVDRGCARGPQGPAGPAGAPGQTGGRGPQGIPGANLIQFSSGLVPVGTTVVSAAPLLLGFGVNAIELINGAGESTSSTQAGGFSFPIPVQGVLSNLEISAEMLTGATVATINTTPMTYVFTVFRATSTPNNGISHVASPYLTTLYTATVTFGGPTNILAPATFYAATNYNGASVLGVNAGDRIGIRVRTLLASDAAAVDVAQLSFSASISYSPLVV